MSRYCDHDITAVLDAAASWRDRCLIADGSILSEQSLWVIRGLAELQRFFIEQPDATKRSFIEKLRDQLTPSTPQTKQLAAEMCWLLVLFPRASAMGGERKRELVTTVWAWSGEELPPDQAMLRAPLEDGVGRPGTAYNTRRWAELAFLITAVHDLKTHDRMERERLLADPWQFATWLDSIRKPAYPQLRHILKYLLFPDVFERLTTGRDKCAILAAFTGKSVREVRALPFVAIDKALYDLRQRLEQQYGTTALDFYFPPLREQWQQARPVDPVVVRYWVEKAHIQGRAYREAGAYALGHVLLSPQRAQDGRDLYREMREVKPGDVVLHLTDNTAITGMSRVAGTVREHTAGLPTTALADCPAYLVPLEAFQRIEPPLTCRLFLESTPWAEQLRQLAAAQPGLFFTHTLQLRQGAYFTEAPQELVHVLNDAYHAQTGQTLPYVDLAPTVDGCKPAHRYRVSDALADLFIEPSLFDEIRDTLKTKKNMILQGPPGVGKTFFSKRLAYALMGEKADTRVAMVQFHPAYAYEDFVQGYRPIAGGFALRNGIFFTFCQRATADSEHPYVFIIDEINRANLSKVFGELMMLLEADKRGPEWAIPLAYAGEADAPFFVPANLYVIGLMNTADRSLAMVDYALRRRFAFVDLLPGFHTTQFRDHLQHRGVDAALIQRIVRKMSALNARITQDTTDLGAGFCIGHSFFCAVPSDCAADEVWYQRVIRSEIAPLLREYWFDDSTKAEELIRGLLMTD